MSIGRDEAECFPCSAWFLLGEAGHPLSLASWLMCLWLCNCILAASGHPLRGPIWAFASTWSTESFLVPLWPVASGRSVLFPATLSGELVHPSGRKNWIWVRVKERLSFIEGEGQDLHASSPTFLNIS